MEMSQKAGFLSNEKLKERTLRIYSVRVTPSFTSSVLFPLS